MAMLNNQRVDGNIIFKKKWDSSIALFDSQRIYSTKNNNLVYGSGYGKNFWLFIYIDWWRMVTKFALKVDVEKDEGGLTSGQH